VLLCSRCDRGQRYCGRACSRAARQESLRAAARRYQRSRAGRLAHAARSRRWRQRRHERARRDAAVDNGGAIDFVTHQGSPTAPEDAPLLPGAQPAAGLAAALSGAVTSAGAARCRRCAALLPPWVRQGFVRHGMRRWPARVLERDP
jgi:hypothetical protein